MGTSITILQRPSLTGWRKTDLTTRPLSAPSVLGTWIRWRPPWSPTATALSSTGQRSWRQGLCSCIAGDSQVPCRREWPNNLHMSCGISMSINFLKSIISALTYTQQSSTPWFFANWLCHRGHDRIYECVPFCSSGTQQSQMPGWTCSPFQVTKQTKSMNY